MTEADMRVWAVLFTLPKVSWNRLVEQAADPILLAADKVKAEQIVDMTLSNLVRGGLIDAARVERDLLGGQATQRVLKEFHENELTSEFNRATEEEALKRRLAKLQAEDAQGVRAKKPEKVEKPETGKVGVKTNAG